MEVLDGDILRCAPANVFLDNIRRLILRFEKIWFVDSTIMIVEVQHYRLTTECVRDRHLVGVPAHELPSSGDSGAVVFGTDAVRISSEAAVAGAVIH